MELKDFVGNILEFTKSKSKICMIETPEFHKTVQVKDFWMDRHQRY
jgi:hypothetical protein